MDRKKHKRGFVTVAAGIAAIALILFSTTNGLCDQPVSVKPQMMIYKPVLKKSGQEAGQQKKVVTQPRTVVGQPVKIDSKKLEQLKVYPTVPPVKRDTSTQQQRIPQFPPEPDSKEGVGSNEYKPKSRDTQYPSATDSREGLDSKPRPDHPGAGCFIATAAYGTPLAGEIMVLKQFRDEQLLAHPIGRVFVKLYYKHSPPIAEYVASHDSLRLATRAALWPIVFGIKHTLMAFCLVMSTIVCAMVLCILCQNVQMKLR